MDPTYSAPVQAPPTEFSPGYLETDDEDLQETSGQEMDTTTVEGKRAHTKLILDQDCFFPPGGVPGLTTRKGSKKSDLWDYCI